MRDRYDQVTLRDAMAGTELRLHDTLLRTGLGLTPLNAGEIRKPFTEDAFRLQRARTLRRLPVPVEEVFATYRRVWEDSGYVINSSASNKLTAEDDVGYVLTLRRTAAGEVLLTALSPPVVDPDRPPSTRLYAVQLAIGFGCGAAPQILLTTLIVNDAGRTAPDSVDRELVMLYGMPDVVLVPFMVGLGLALMFVSARSRPFGAGLLTGTALATLIMSGVCVTATSPS